jgi:hypothetical protein
VLHVPRRDYEYNRSEVDAMKNGYGLKIDENALMMFALQNFPRCFPHGGHEANENEPYLNISVRVRITIMPLR